MWMKDEYPGKKPWWLTAQQWEAWVLFEEFGRGGSHDMIARHGSLAVLQWAAAQGCPLDKSEFGLCSIAAKRGHLEMLQWARGCQWGLETCRWAAEHGRIEILDHLRDNGCNFPEDNASGSGILGMAARGGHIDVLKWGLEDGCELCIMDCYLVCSVLWPP
jgi:hypothetical protein